MYNDEMLRLFSELPEDKRKLTLALKKYNKDKLEVILTMLIAGGSFKRSQIIARFLGRDLTKDELEVILSNRILEGYLRGAIEFSKLIGRELTKIEFEKLLNVNLKFGELDLALKIAGELGRSLSEGECDEVLVILVFEDEFISAMRLVEGLPEPKKEEWLKKIKEKKARIEAGY